MRKYFLLAVVLLLTNVMCSQQQGPNAADRTACEKGFVSLFDGKTLAGWQGHLEEYGVVDGMLVCKEGALNVLYTDRQYSDFILRLEYRIGPGGNNGIGIRTPIDPLPPAFVGMEIQILDDTAPGNQKLKPVQYNGSVYGAVAAERGHLKPVGEWNTMEIVAKGPHIRVIVNGAEVVNANLDKVGPKRIHNRDLDGLHNKTGYVAICGHQHYVEFRNIRIKELCAK